MTRARDVANIDGLLTTTGDTYYASAAGTPARLGIGTTGQVVTVASGLPAWSTPAAAAFVGCQSTKSANQSISNETDTTITWNTNTFDTDSIHDTVTNNSRFTVPTGKGGKWLLSCTLDWFNNTAGDRYLTLLVNGTMVQLSYGGAFAAGASNQTLTTILSLSAADYVEIKGYQTSGGALNVVAANRATHMNFQYLGA